MGILDGKAVVVTGAGRGLGESYARHAAAAGARVVVNDVAGAERVAAGIGGAVAHTGSVADPEQAAALVELCVAEFGRIDGLVNNAGVTCFAEPWDDDPAAVREVIEVNVLGTMYCGTAAARAMRGGSIVNVVSGAMLGRAGAAAYSASKGAVASLTASWASSLAPRGVRVNGVAPLAWTPMMDADPGRHEVGSAAGPPDRMAPLVTYLLSDLAAGVTGQLVRFLPDKLHLISQYAAKRPVLVRERWEVEDIARAFEDELEPEPPGRDRWRV
ncbi:SDR family NAD(P)-dependent oxidoreductase [Saccharothrix syringae]|uniref:SDR family oxidoreductase n=1 Tax=Saccharothrix syringae TaxID=103733 RepID=A0A1X9WEM1_SACSY|nr:SDR family oxidoreductase [Saccharothrix syringae]ARS01461.1 short-chain dehydrogenase [Saccharothrix syringae]QFZ19265.1 SDR family oxidoreductase [Saccharothrix syringae]